MGEVLRAQDLKLDQTIALKLLPAGLRGDERRLSRLLNEVRVARRVSHPNVCRVYDVVEGEGRSFLTMEFIEGETLGRLLERKGRLPRDEALSLARQITTGLAAAHERGVLHRDLKPANVMVDERGIARITDFGLAEAARVVAGSRAREGTPPYMSPEALHGQEVDARSDLYALGLLLYEIFTGKAAFPRRTLEPVPAGAEDEPQAPSRVAGGIDPRVERVILRCIEADPAKRPASARAVAEALPQADLAAGAILEAAQRRADRIAAFREELRELRGAGVLRVDEPAIEEMDRYHRSVLNDLVRDFDVDLSEREKQISLGMRIVSTLGAIALAASAFYFFYRIWGLISLPLQVAVLIGAPIAALAATALVSARDRSGHFAAMATAFAFACAVADVSVMVRILNQPLSPYAFVAWGALGLILAYGYRLRLPLAAGVLSLALGGAALLPYWAGLEWSSFLDRPGGLMPVGLLAFLAPGFGAARRSAPFAPLYRALGLVLFLWPSLVLSMEGHASYLPLPSPSAEIVHQIVGLAASAAAIAIGIRWRFKETAYGGFVFVVAHLCFRFADWCWDWMPRYLFFLILAAMAVGVLVVLKRLRSVLAARDDEVRP